MIMERDESYNQAMSFFSDGEYEKAYNIINYSSTLSSQERDDFKAKCLSFITEQYIFIINASSG